MKYVKRFWIPVILLIAFIAATVYTTSNSYSITEEGRMDWIDQHQDNHLATLMADQMDSRCLADTLAIGDDLELQLWRFEVSGEFYNDVILWRQGGGGNYKVAYEYCIAQAAVEETFGSGRIEYSFQQGLYKYTGQIDEQFHVLEPTRSLSLIGPLLCAALVVGYVALTIASLRYRKKEQAKKAAQAEQ